MVPKVGLEPTRLAAGDFESPASTIPPLGPLSGDVTRPCAGEKSKNALDAIFLKLERRAKSKVTRDREPRRAGQLGVNPKR